jgi:hypothetical protein
MFSNSWNFGTQPGTGACIVSISAGQTLTVRNIGTTLLAVGAAVDGNIIPSVTLTIVKLA